MGRYSGSNKARAKAFAKAKSSGIIKAHGVYHIVPPRAGRKHAAPGEMLGSIGGKPAPETADEAVTPEVPPIPAPPAFREMLERRRQRFARRRRKHSTAARVMATRAVARAEASATTPPRSQSWRDFDPATLPESARDLEVELTTYRDQLDEILEHRGEYVVISGREIIGYAPDLEAAIAIARPLGPVPVLVKRVVEFDPVVSLGGLT